MSLLPTSSIEIALGYQEMKGKNAGFNGGGATLNAFGNTSGVTAVADGAKKTLYGSLVYHVDRQFDVYVAADMMFYYEKGNPSAVRSPDCMVILGVPNHRRPSWLAWEEKAMPAVVFEIASKRTFRDDLRSKRVLYERLGIPEYILFDPIGFFFRDQRLRGFRLREGSYVEIEQGDEEGLVSEQLGLMIYPEGDILRLVDMRTHRSLRTAEEASGLYEHEVVRNAELKRMARAARRRAARALKAERQRAEQLVAEVERLRAMLGPRADEGGNA